jgi:type VI secretion system protein ImpG
MRDDLLHQYERELAFLRQTGAEFARKYPKVASRLLLEPNKSDDPHVERLLEAFAFLAARVHLKIDDDFPEVSEALLNVVYPNYIRPLPSMSLVEFHLDPEQGKLTTGLTIPRDTQLVSRLVGGAPCKFRTCYDTTLWPLEVSGARWAGLQDLGGSVASPDAVGALRIELSCLPEISFEELEVDTIRFHINAESNLAATLYELLFNNCIDVLARDPTRGAKGQTISLSASALSPVGFAEDEGMVPYEKRSFLAYRLLQEYFVFPEKYLFLDVSGLSRLRESGFREKAELVFLISKFGRADRRSLLETGLSAGTFRLGATPIVNLFTKASEPILLNQRKQEYLVVPDARRRETTGIFSIDRVVAVTRGQNEPIPFEPFYSFRHEAHDTRDQTFWSAKRRPVSWRTDEGTDVYLSFADLSARIVHPELDAVTAYLTCHNGDLPSRLPFGNEAQGDFQMPGSGPVAKIVALVKPTAVVEPPLGKPQLWRLISQLSLNYLSLVEGGAEGLRELLRLHDFTDSASNEKQIKGITDVVSTPCYSRIETEHGLTFARGHRVEMEFDEEQFAGAGMFLFAAVLERFLGLYTSLNSFVILAARSGQRKELVREWLPRAGWKVLL